MKKVNEFFTDWLPKTAGVVASVAWLAVLTLAPVAIVMWIIKSILRILGVI